MSDQLATREDLQYEAGMYRSLYEVCKQQARIHAQEARGANHTIGQIYQLCTGAKGEPGNWNGAEPVRKLVAERDRLLNALIWMRARDDRNGSLPEAYREKIDEALARSAQP